MTLCLILIKFNLIPYYIHTQSFTCPKMVFLTTTFDKSQSREFGLYFAIDIGCAINYIPFVMLQLYWLVIKSLNH